MRLLDRPIIWIVIFGALTAFVWEALQMPFYAMDHLSHRQMIMTCALASIADAGLMALAYGLALRFGSPGVSNPMPLLIYAGAGLAAIALVEQVMVSASWGWRYSKAMPVIPCTNIGIVPILMWIMVPLLTLWMARRMTRPAS
ncbi:MAG: hypothetical protein V7651_13670 [Hyphomonas oceanitis]|jgi:hypothetical protein|uniref:Uncharacterized protein n=1 Tax=Hyphomonas oceanitis SCH89 TaxID=1280953 RepID=A0A059G1E1_9PROT|nr:hypothetical protein [Hyphomonas oceanitis]KDA00004.1 hypothetical protein HOC_19611 [Hyphomonas oceanitis SCH89]|tara:strand:+ start:175 stop:603 length:429 start_codon:yes stop_codon:yes gene_type:complete